MKTITKNLNDRAFKCLLNGSKRVEIRPKKNDYSENSIDILNRGDSIIFTNIINNEKLEAKVERKTLYKSIRKLLDIEGTKHTLSSTNNMEEGIKSIVSIPGYKELIGKNGVYSVKLKNIRKLN